MYRIVNWATMTSIAFLLLTACQTPDRFVAEVPGTEAAQAVFPSRLYENLSRQGDGTVFRMDGEASEVRFFMWRGGPMAYKGHNHVMRISNMEGAAYFPKDMLADNPRIDIVFPVADIEVDPLPLRKEVGGAFASSGMTGKGARKTREHMLAESSMNAERFPKIGLSAKKVHGEPPKLVLDMALTIHGIERRQLIPATVRIQDGTLTAAGSFVIRQTDYGIEPSSAMGGALYVQDPIMIEFNIVARSK